MTLEKEIYTFQKGDYLIRQGEKVARVYRLLDGECYRMTINEQGDEYIYAVKSSENPIESLIGVLVLFSDSRISGGSFIAKTTCHAQVIDADYLLSALDNRPDILKALLKMLINDYNVLNQSFHSRQEGKAANLLCRFLLNHSSKNTSGALICDVHNNSELAGYIGIHKVTVFRVLKQLKNEGIIKRDGHSFTILDAKALEDYALGKKFIYH